MGPFRDAPLAGSVGVGVGKRGPACAGRGSPADRRAGQGERIWMTILVGVIAALIGGILWEAIFPDNDGIAWIGSIIVGVVLVWLYATLIGRSRTRAG